MEKLLEEIKRRAGLSEGPLDYDSDTPEDEMEYDDHDDTVRYVIEHHTSSGAPFVEEADDWKVGDAIETLIDKSPLEQGQYIVIRLPGADGR